MLITSEFQQQAEIEDFYSSGLYSLLRGKIAFFGGSRLAELSLRPVSDSHPLIDTGQIQMAHLLSSYQKICISHMIEFTQY